MRDARLRGAALREAGVAALEPRFGDWWIFEHCFPFNVARCYDETDMNRRTRYYRGVASGPLAAAIRWNNL